MRFYLQIRSKVVGFLNERYARLRMGVTRKRMKKTTMTMTMTMMTSRWQERHAQGNRLSDQPMTSFQPQSEGSNPHPLSRTFPLSPGHEGSSVGHHDRSYGGRHKR